MASAYFLPDFEMIIHIFNGQFQKGFRTFKRKRK